MEALRGNDVTSFLCTPPFWSLSELKISGKRELVSPANGYLFRTNGVYLEYYKWKMKEAIWKYNDTTGVLSITYFDSTQFFTIHKLDKDNLVLENEQGNTYLFGSQQYLGAANYGFTRRIDDVNYSSVAEIKKNWEKRREEEKVKKFTLIGCEPFNEGFAVITIASNEDQILYGYINKFGEYVVEPQYEKAYPFAGGYGLVKTFYSKKDEYFFITPGGNNAFGKTFSEARSFNEGFAAVRDKQGKWGFITNTGELKIDYTYQEVDDFHDGMARVKQRDRWGYIDQTGKEIVIPQFICANNFSEGYALVGQFVDYHFTQYSFIDKAGKIAFKVNRENSTTTVTCCSPIYNANVDRTNSQECTFKDGLAVVITGPPASHIIFNREGKRTHAPEDTHKFNEGLAAARKTVGQKYGFIGVNGSWKIDPVFDYARQFREGLAAVKVNNNWGFVDKSGNIVINKEISQDKTSIQSSETFEFVSDFSEGMSLVRVRGKFGYIDKQGKWIITPTFVNAFPFTNGMARVKLESKKGWNYIDKGGNILFAHFY